MIFFNLLMYFHWKFLCIGLVHNWSHMEVQGHHLTILYRNFVVLNVFQIGKKLRLKNVSFDVTVMPSSRSQFVTNDQKCRQNDGSVPPGYHCLLVIIRQYSHKKAKLHFCRVILPIFWIHTMTTHYEFLLNSSQNNFNSSCKNCQNRCNFTTLRFF